MEKPRKLPIGIQSFEKLREGGFLYVDKTDYVYRLAESGIPYFLSRPRRFGKSLFLSTLRAYFEGRRDLFEGLKIMDLEGDGPDAWQTYPVFYIDFNKENFRQEKALEMVLEAHVRDWEAIYGDDEITGSLPIRFQRMIKKAYESTGKRVAVLVDEYDKPLLEGADPEQIEHNKAAFKGFFSTLKSYDQYLKFVFITGVTKFSKVSIFSDLNQLKDISLLPDYAGICGITEKELNKNFMPEIEACAAALDITADECRQELKKMYDGYHFGQNTDGVYNPFSLLNALQDRQFDMYWFSSGTPTFLLERLKKSSFDPKQITEGEVYADSSVLTDYRYDNPNPVPLFYQSGYLTIKSYDKRFRSYQLDYPNDEVRYGFLNSLVPIFLQTEDKEEKDPLDIRSFVTDIEKARTDSLKDRFTALFAKLPYPNDEKIVEQNFQNVIYIVFMLLGQYTMTEIHSAKGRADCIVETADYVYLFEFKRDKSAEEALRQIDDAGYAKPYAADPRKLLKVGVNFNSKDRTIDGWEMA